MTKVPVSIEYNNIHTSNIGLTYSEQHVSLRFQSSYILFLLIYVSHPPYVLEEMSTKNVSNSNNTLSYTTPQPVPS